MISEKDALNLINSNIKYVGKTKIDILKSHGHFLALDVISLKNSPPFDKSAMDGFALGKNYQKYQNFKIIHTLAAGQDNKIKLEKNLSYRVMTGAKVPLGAIKIIPFENTLYNENSFKIIKESSKNICQKGEDFKKGYTLFAKNTLLTPLMIATIASSGVKEVLVYKKPTVGLITTGDELVQDIEKIVNSKIFNSNYEIISRYLENDKYTTEHIHIKDDEKQTSKILRDFSDKCDIVFTTGGISKGDFDFIRKFLGSNAKKIYQSVAIKPARPNGFYIFKNTPFICFPGNPVAATLSYLIFGRVQYIPVIYNGKSLVMPKYRGPADLLTLAKSNGFLIVPKSESNFVNTTKILPVN